jgi:hypothetical protein
MNSYWMNELVFAGTTCPTWLVWVLGILVVGFLGAMAWVIKDTWID